jgi:hypothetical protein
LYANLTGPEGQPGEDGKDGADAGDSPHDHDEFAPVEHDHATETISPEIVNIRQGPFPENLVGMPDMAMYDRTGSIQMISRSNATFKIGPDADWEGKRPVYNGFVIETGLEAYGESASTQPISIIGSGGLYLNGGGDVGTPPVRMGTLMLAGDPQVTGDLTVDGTAKLSINVPPDYRYNTTPGVVFIEGYGFIGKTSGNRTSVTSNGYPNLDFAWTSLGAQDGNGPLYGTTQIDLAPTGQFDVRVANSYPTGSERTPPSRFKVTESGPTFRAMPSKTRTVDDVLERAETAEFAPEDDEGVAMMDGHDEVPLFEVMSALLAKVKQQGEQIAALQVSTARFDKLESDIALIKAKQHKLQQ